MTYPNLHTIFIVGGGLDPPTLAWAQEKTGKPIIDNWWQTETGWLFVANLIGLEPMPVKAGSSTKPVPGYNIEILNEQGEVLGPNQQGFIALKRPLPPCCLLADMGAIMKGSNLVILNVFPGYYICGDGGYFDSDGYLYIMGRVDDVINVAGHRLSTGEMEEVVAEHPAIAECAVVGVRDELKGQLPLGLVVLKDGVKVDDNQLERAKLLMLYGQNWRGCLFPASYGG